MCTDPEATLGPHGLVLVPVPLCEAPLLAHVDLLAAGEFELGATQRLNHVVPVLVSGAHRQQDLPDVHARHGAVRLAKSAAHPGLEP